MRILYLFYFLLPLTSSCSTGTTKVADLMCVQLAAFAETVEPGQSHSVVLRGGWGGDTQDTLMTHDCKHAGYEPAQVLCEYLVPNTSWEFGSYNAKRAATCLDSADRKDFIRRVEKYELPAEITSSLRALTDKTVQVSVRLEFTRPSGSRVAELSVLTLSVTRGN